MKRVYLIALGLISFFQATSQDCESCKTREDFQTDYCFVDNDFPEYCVQFALDEDKLVLGKGKKTRLIPLRDTTDIHYFIDLASNKSYKLTAQEILLLQIAIDRWKEERRDIGLQYTTSGLGYKILKEGNGNFPSDGDQVSVHYRGTLVDGTPFDSSYDRGQPITFPLGQGRVIKGWDEGIKLLSEGAKGLLKIPADLGYGSRGAGGVIPPNATLYFEVEVVGIE